MSQVSKRNEIRTLWTSKIYTSKQISRALNVSSAIVYRVIRQNSEQQSLDHHRGAGRPAIDKSVVKQIRDYPWSPFAKFLRNMDRLWNQAIFAEEASFLLLVAQ